MKKLAFIIMIALSLVSITFELYLVYSLLIILRMGLPLESVIKNIFYIALNIVVILTIICLFVFAYKNSIINSCYKAQLKTEELKKNIKILKEEKKQRKIKKLKERLTELESDE